jgi:hypothetical protein
MLSLPFTTRSASTLSTITGHLCLARVLVPRDDVHAYGVLQDLHPTNVIEINSDSHTCTTLLPGLQTMGPNRSQIGFLDGRSLGGQVMTAWIGTWASSNDSCSSFLISVVFIVNVGKGFMIMWL